ncbi:MAG: TauD/TfdA family dioxygenase, partial [Marinobacter sp.]
EMHPLKATTSDKYPELFVLENGGDKDKYNTAFYSGEEIVGRLDWHMDLHYTGKPNHGALLTAVTVAGEGGLTGFGDLAKAYDALDDETKDLLEKIEVVYSFSMQRRHMRYVNLDGYCPGPYSPKKPSDIGFPDFPDAAYPAAYKHPVSGRKILGIVEQFLDRVVTPLQFGLSNDESIELLERLVAHIRKPEFHYFHKWQKGDLVLWDNWRAMHCTTGTKPGIHRVINRTTIEGNTMLGRVLTTEP